MPHRALIIDTDHTLRSVLREKLMHEDFQVTEASDGKVGIALAMKERPDIILLEMIIPEHNGMEILAQLRQNEWGRTAKVVLFTHLKDTHEMLRGITAYEPSLYLIKGSWEISDVVAKVKEVLGIEAK